MIIKLHLIFVLFLVNKVQTTYKNSNTYLQDSVDKFMRVVEYLWPKTWKLDYQKPLCTPTNDSISKGWNINRGGRVLNVIRTFKNWKCETFGMSDAMSRRWRGSQRAGENRFFLPNGGHVKFDVFGQVNGDKWSSIHEQEIYYPYEIEKRNKSRDELVILRLPRNRSKGTPTA